MNIAIDISQIVFEGTGVSEYTKNIVKGLLSIDQNNIYILFGVSHGRFEQLLKFTQEACSINQNVIPKLYRFPLRIPNYMWNTYHLINVERFIGAIDIFHSSDWIQPPSRAKKITTIHDLVVYKYPHTSHLSIIKTQRKRLNWVVKECDVICADSMATKKDILDLFKVDPKRIEVVYPGVKQEFYPKESREIAKVLKKYNLEEEYIMSVGTIEPRKNISAVIQAFDRFTQNPLIATKKRPMILLLVGKMGWGGITSISSKNIRVLGYVEQNDLPSLYSAAKFFIYPSLYEGFGLPVLEAMSCGCPVITSDRGSLKEVAEHSAVIINPERIDEIVLSMTKMSLDESFRQSVIKRGLQRANHFKWEKTALKLLKIYEDLR